jgi:hypothetical protein
MEAATAMIFNSVSWWVFGFARNAALDFSRVRHRHAPKSAWGGATPLCRSRAVSGSGRAAGSRADDGEA